jgi:hypothetical protein
MPGEVKNPEAHADRPGVIERVRFDYDCLSSSVAKFLKGQADRIKRQCVTSIIQIGKALLEAKRHLSHGEFVHWVEGEAGIPARTAQAYMRVASWASTKGTTVAQLAPSTLYLLSASSTPKEFVSDVLGRIQAGESIPPSVLRRQLVALRKTGQHVEAEGSMPENSGMTDATLGWSAIAMTELVEILMRGLSEPDFARVRCIATDEAVLSDPSLAKNLERAFVNCGITSPALASTRRGVEERANT